MGVKCKDTLFFQMLSEKNIFSCSSSPKAAYKTAFGHGYANPCPKTAAVAAATPHCIMPLRRRKSSKSLLTLSFVERG